MNKTIPQIATRIVKWYDQQGRKSLPWRLSITPYRIWISEIMLQQTQVNTVIPYFEKFIEHFPTVKQLANASEDEVLHLWSGLGYYSRARNLHKTAKIIVEQHMAIFPDEFEALISLPGIGRSTAGAILAIAFQQQAAILDGNVRRILTRLHAIEGWPGKTDIQKKLWFLAEKYTPTDRVDDYTQAIMDLGATICTRRNPSCLQCPLVKNCIAHQLNVPNNFPTPKPKKAIPTKSTRMLIIKNREDGILLLKRPPVGIWGGLWSLPECSLEENIKTFCLKQLGITVQTQRKLETFKHTFSHYHLLINPVVLECDFQKKVTGPIMEPQQTTWYNRADKNVRLGLPAPVSKLLKLI